MSTVNIDIKKNVYNDVYYPYLADERRIQIYFGGSSSGKSVFLGQRLVRDLLKGGRNYLCARNVSATLKTSVFNEIRKVIADFGVSELFIANKSDLTITCRNGYQAICKGLDDVEKIKSLTPEKGVLTDIWIEEATECKHDDLRQLNKRLRGRSGVKKRLTMSFNPVLKAHWISQEFFSGQFGDTNTLYEDDDLLILKTIYSDNRFLEPDDIKALEAETDDYFYQVYTLGNWGVLGDLIFNNYEIKDLTGIKKTFAKFKNGLDFGFSNDPTALIRTSYSRPKKTIYVTDEFSQLGITNDEIANEIRPIIGTDVVVCDSSEPKSIKELKNYKINAIGAKKGKDSIKHGIQWLKQQRIVIDKRCQDVVNEFQQYHWRKDRLGNVLNEPVDKYNHFIDALRYAYEDEMKIIDVDFSAISLQGTSKWAQ